jgi:hypothetical protein
MWIVIGIVVVVVLIVLFLLVNPGSPARGMRNTRDGQAGWREGGQVSWFHDNERNDTDTD